ncbi:MAG: dihydroneopterin aldolase [Bacteroidales bacterium]|nr:dihydroneopterin aldolase [Bacteroidales bacterium]
MDYIEIKGMKFHSYIGHYDEEKEIGNKFNVDLKLVTNSKKAAKTDNLNYGLDYVTVYSVVKQEMNKKCNLVENVTERIVAHLFQNFSKIEALEIKVTKLSPKIGGMVDEVSIIKNIERSEYEK